MRQPSPTSYCIIQPKVVLGVGRDVRAVCYSTGVEVMIIARWSEIQAWKLVLKKHLIMTLMYTWSKFFVGLRSLELLQLLVFT